MFEIDLKSRKTISEQIVDGIKELIVSGVMLPGEKMLSVREMAGQITVNPNTVQKAYRTLEQQGFIFTAQGRGTFVSNKDDIVVSEKEISKARAHVAESLDKLYFLGLSKDESRKIVDELFERREEWK